MKKFVWIVYLYMNTFLFAQSLKEKIQISLYKGQYIEMQKLLKKAGHQGDIDAQLDLALMYEEGKYIPQNYAKAVYWYQKAANKKNIDAQYRLGTLYYEGKYIAQNYAKALRWYKKAAKQGDVQAQYNVAYIYEHALGVKQDDMNAIKWYELAGKHQNIDAQYNAATLYYREKQYDKAVFWYKKSGKNGDDKALYNLGVMFFYGNGVKQNKITTFHYWLEAAKHSNIQAQDSLDLLCKESPWACK